MLNKNVQSKIGASGPKSGLMVTVKKADGTVARITLAELKEMRAKRDKSGSGRGGNAGEGVKRGAAAREEFFKEKEDIKNSSAAALGASGPAWEKDDHKSLLDQSFHNEDLYALIKARRTALAKVSPVKDIWVDEAAANTSPPEERASGSVQAQRAAVSAAETKEKAPPCRVKKSVNPVLHDVQAPYRPKKRGVGPVDEMAVFSLADWRRLAPGARAAGSKIMVKFETLKEESYLMYMDAVQSWYNNPLCLAYQDVIAESLRSGRTVAEVLSEARGGDTLTIEEFNEIAALNRDLAY